MFLFLLFPALISANGMLSEDSEIVLTAHGMGMQDPGRIVIPIHAGRIPLLPCVMAGAGTHEHGETFTKDSFHYQCSNGTAQVVACIAHDGSVVQLGRVFVKNGLRHKCNVQGDNVSYEQGESARERNNRAESMCHANGRNYEVGESFRNGTFHIKCGRDGFIVAGCYVQGRLDELLMGGESRLFDGQKHECFAMADGRLRYTVMTIGCQHNGQNFNIGQIWTDGHVRYRCNSEGSITVLGCVDDQLFLELGRDLLMNGFVHRCYQVDNTAFYHRFSCPDGNSLSSCIAVNSVVRARRVRA